MFEMALHIRFVIAREINSISELQLKAKHLRINSSDSSS